MESCRPLTISDALGEMKSGDATVFAGGTDLMVRKVWKNKCVFIGSIPELKTVRKTKSGMEIGAAATITELLENPIIPDFMKKVFEQMASPAIRNRATLGGNAGNASPAGDSLPMLYALRAGIVLADLDPAGQVFTRTLPIRDFITGVRKTVIRPEELIVRFLIPADSLGDQSLYYEKKVGARRAEAISKLSFFGRVRRKDGKIEDFAAAFGAVGRTVVTNAEAEELIRGMTMDELSSNREKIMTLYDDVIHPIDDQRSTADYRKTVSMNLLRDFLDLVEKDNS